MTLARALLLVPTLLAPLGMEAQTGRPGVPRPLADYVGTYGDTPRHPVEIVAGDALFAVIDEAKYALRSAGMDMFTNAGGDTIPFRRDARGRVVGYIEHGTLHKRLSLTVSSASAALIRPRAGEAASPAAYRYRPPVDRHDGIAIGDIAASDLGAETAERIVRGVLDGTWPNVNGVLLYQHGRLVLEEYFYGYGIDRPQQLRSATKSIVSALVGAAIDRGALPGTDTPVLPRLGYASLANPDPRKARITIGDLLTMRPGLACDDHDGRSPGGEVRIYPTPDWVKTVLDLPMASDPGTDAHYCSGAVAVAGRATELAVHATLPDFAQAALFGPLGVRRSDWRWNYTLTNANQEYAQIHLRPRDMLKVGLLYADSGRWHGRQVLSERWVAASLAPQSQVENTGYGYFWWRPWLRVVTPAGEQRVDFNAAQGNGGQKIYLVPQYDLVAVFTGSDYNSGGSPPNKIMAGVILPRLIDASHAAPPAR